jgi:hypothetical protein
MGRSDRPDTWKLPHHKKSILKALKGKLDIERTVNWDRMPAAVAALSPGGYLGQRPDVSGDGEIIESARHPANHYVRAGRPVPDTFAVLI